MSVIIVPRRHYTQPQTRVVPSADFPVQGLIAYSGKETSFRDVASGAEYPFPTQFSGGLHLKWFPSPVGMQVRNFQAASVVARQVHVPDFVPRSPRWSIAARLQQPADDSIYVSGNGTGGGIAGENGSILIRRQGGVLQLVRQGVAVVLSSSSSVPADRSFSFVITFNGQTARLYLDGRLDAQANYTYDFPTVSAGQCIWRSVNNSSLDYFGIFDRELCEAEARAIHFSPSMLFRADPIRIYSLPTGPIGISWSSLTASNITQTGATLTLGGITR